MCDQVHKLTFNSEKCEIRKEGSRKLVGTAVIQGIKFCSKIQSARNHFKSNGSVGLVVMNPMQLIWVQTDVRSERYRILFKMKNRQKKGC
jgi:hypothetical protein